MTESSPAAGHWHDAGRTCHLDHVTLDMEARGWPRRIHVDDPVRLAQTIQNLNTNNFKAPPPPPKYERTRKSFGSGTLDSFTQQEISTRRMT